MKVLAIVKPAGAAPMEMVPAIMDAFAAWREQWKPIMESFYFFASNQGGCGIVNAPDETTLHSMWASFPWGLFSTVELHPLVDGDVALKNFTEIVRKMMAPPQ